MKIKLNENQLQNIIKESIKESLSEIDYKTLVNTANKRKDEWWKNHQSGFDKEANKSFKSYKDLMDYARDVFDRDHGYSDEDGYLKTDIDQCCSDHRIRSYPVKPDGRYFETYAPYFITNQNFYGQNGQHEPGKWCVGTVGWAGAIAASPDFDSKEEAYAYAKKNNLRLTPKDKISDKLLSKAEENRKELDNFYQGKTKYIKGKGWQ